MPTMFDVIDLAHAAFEREYVGKEKFHNLKRHPQFKNWYECPYVNDRWGNFRNGWMAAYTHLKLIDCGF